MQNVTMCLEKQHFSDIIALANFYNIISELLSITIPKNLHNTVNSDFAQIMDYINNNFTNPDLCITMVASLFSYSSAYLSRLIKKNTGQAYSSIIKQLRLKKAIALFETGMTNISEVSEMIGFTDPYYFSNVFKEENGKIYTNAEEINRRLYVACSRCKNKLYLKYGK